MMLKLLFYGVIKVTVVWSLAIYFSVLVCCSIAKDWLLRFGDKPRPLKRRDEAPKCLKDPKYGVHKYVRVNVSNFNFCCFVFRNCQKIIRTTVQSKASEIKFFSFRYWLHFYITIRHRWSGWQKVLILVPFERDSAHQTKKQHQTFGRQNKLQTNRLNFKRAK